MGGLGKLMTIGNREVWVCDNTPPCLLPTSGIVCYTYSEQQREFWPWGLWQDVLGPRVDAAYEEVSISRTAGVVRGQVIG